MDTTILIWIALVLFSLFTTGKLLVGIGQSAWHLHKARTSGGTVIRCNSTVYKMWIYLFALVTEGGLTFWLTTIALRFQRLPVLYRVLTWTVVATTAIDFIIHAVAIFREKYCYLTDEGVLCYIKVFPFAKCRFGWEEAADPARPSDTLHVYPPKEKLPFTVVFPDQIEEAHTVVQTNQTQH